MDNYKISDECRYYLDAILPTFIYNRTVYIAGSVKELIINENGDDSKENVWRISRSIRSFLEQNGFGHSVDYVFIIDKKGEDLKNIGSLKAYEEHQKS